MKKSTTSDKFIRNVSSLSLCIS